MLEIPSDPKDALRAAKTANKSIVSRHVANKVSKSDLNLVLCCADRRAGRFVGIDPSSNRRGPRRNVTGRLLPRLLVFLYNDKNIELDSAELAGGTQKCLAFRSNSVQ
jgi:hypothetical protein